MLATESIVIATHTSTGAGGHVSGLVHTPVDARAGFVFAHGAGAGMAHPFMTDVAAGLAARGVATLRYQFDYMQRGSKRPDGPALAHAAVRAAVASARLRWPGLPLLAGGRSFGGRMTSQAQAAAPLDGVLGLVFFAFPLHPAGQPGSERAEHLERVSVPMLFLHGTRDALAAPVLLDAVLARLGTRAQLHRIDDADHAFHVRVRSGRTDAQVLAAMLDRVVAWSDALVTGA